MLVGAISDTHDNLEQVDRAVEIFIQRKVGALIHCGDFITPLVYDRLKGLNVPFYGVFGNNDYEEALSQCSHNQIRREPYRFILGGRSFFICHQHAFVQSGQLPGDVDVVVYGETHEPEVRHVGRVLVVNPGESCGWVNGRSTVALIDLESMTAEIVELAI